MEEGTNKGGILADDMGLGKTISALALILTRPPTDRARKVWLLMPPTSYQLSNYTDYTDRRSCCSYPPMGEGDSHESQSRA